MPTGTSIDVDERNHPDEEKAAEDRADCLRHDEAEHGRPMRRVAAAMSGRGYRSSLKARPMVTAGFANEVDGENQ